MLARSLARSDEHKPWASNGTTGLADIRFGGVGFAVGGVAHLSPPKICEADRIGSDGAVAGSAGVRAPIDHARKRSTSLRGSNLQPVARGALDSII